MLWKKPMYSRARRAVVGDCAPTSSRRFRLATAIALTLGMTANSSAAILLSWNTFGNVGTETTEPAVSNDANLSATAPLSLGAGVTAAANGNRFGGSNWFDTGDSNPQTLAQAVSGNDYIQFTVTPVSGASFTPTSFDFIWDFSGTGPSSVAIKSSADGYAATLGQLTSMTASTSAVKTMTLTGLSNVTATTTFRFYGFGGTSPATGGTGGFDTGTNAANVILNGTTAVPSPAITPSVGSTAFGNLLLGAVASKTVTLTNSGSATMTSYTANATGDITANPTSATGLSVGTSSSTTSQVVLYTGSAGSKSGSVTYTPGPGGSASSALNFTATVGQASYDAVTTTTFGPTSSASTPVSVTPLPTALSATGTGAATSGLPKALHSMASILFYTNSTSGDTGTVAMKMRTRTVSEASQLETLQTTEAPNTGGSEQGYLYSDVVDLSGMTDSGLTTDVFVLQMSYDPALLYGHEENAAAHEFVYLASYDTTALKWVNATALNTSGTPEFVNRAYQAGDELVVGRWGVNTANHTVWAVLNHNSEFAVIPEPSSLAAASITVLGFIAVGLRRRRSK